MMNGLSVEHRGPNNPKKTSRNGGFQRISEDTETFVTWVCLKMLCTPKPNG